MWVFLSKCLFVKDNLGQKLRFLSKRKAEAQSLINRNSYGRSSTKIAALKNFPKFTGKHLWWSVFFNKVSRFRPAFLFKKSLEQDFFLVNFEKFLRTPFLLDVSWQLFLNQGEKFKLFFFYNAAIVWPIPCYWSLLIPPESIRKPLVFWCFHGVSKEISGMKRANGYFMFCC